MDEPHFRRDALTGEWIILTPGRHLAGGRAPEGGLPELGSRCPFCPGHEIDTHTTVAQVPADGPWRIRVVENRYPIIHEGPLLQPGRADMRRAFGHHEVVIESPRHDLDLKDFTNDELLELFGVYQQRATELSQRPGMRHVALFRNRGWRSGSSQPHPHGQAMALADIGDIPRRTTEMAARHFEAYGTSLLESVVETEIAAGVRIIDVDAHFIAFCPYAPLEAFHVRIAPRLEPDSFTFLSPTGMKAFSAMALRVLRALDRAFGGKDYNLVWYLPPLEAPAGPTRYWFFDIIPRTRVFAGMEWATGFRSTSHPPEETAEAIRKALGE